MCTRSPFAIQIWPQKYPSILKISSIPSYILAVLIIILYYITSFLNLIPVGCMDDPFERLFRVYPNCHRAPCAASLQQTSSLWFIVIGSTCHQVENSIFSSQGALINATLGGETACWTVTYPQLQIIFLAISTRKHVDPMKIYCVLHVRPSFSIFRIFPATALVGCWSLNLIAHWREKYQFQK